MIVVLIVTVKYTLYNTPERELIQWNRDTTIELNALSKDFQSKVFG